MLLLDESGELRCLVSAGVVVDDRAASVVVRHSVDAASGGSCCECFGKVVCGNHEVLICLLISLGRRVCARGGGFEKGEMERRVFLSCPGVKC